MYVTITKHISCGIWHKFSRKIHKLTNYYNPKTLWLHDKNVELGRGWEEGGDNGEKGANLERGEGYWEMKMWD